MKLSNGAQTLILLLCLVGGAIVLYPILSSSGTATLSVDDMPEVLAMAMDKGMTVEKIESVIDFPREQIILANGEPAYVSVQYCLIGFEGAHPDSTSTRSKTEAVSLVNSIQEELNNGADFADLIAKHSDDGAPGILNLANNGLPGDMSPDAGDNKVLSRSLVEKDGKTLGIGTVVRTRALAGKAFCQIAFKLPVGEFDVAAWDEENSPYGWYIINRIR